MTDPTGGFWHRPDRASVAAFGLAGTASALWFVLVYGVSDLITAHRSLRVPIHFAWETRLPLVPGAVWIYMSIYGLFLAAPFILRSPREIVALAVTHASLVAAAAIGFLALPAALAYPAADLHAGAITAALYRAADRLNLDYNLLPSLHVALSVSCAALYAPHARRSGRMLLWLWALAISASTVLTHFHHVLDAVTGFGLGLVGARVVFPWTIERLRGRPAAAAHQH